MFEEPWCLMSLNRTATAPHCAHELRASVRSSRSHGVQAHEPHMAPLCAGTPSLQGHPLSGGTLTAKAPSLQGSPHCKGTLSAGPPPLCSGPLSARATHGCPHCTLHPEDHQCCFAHLLSAPGHPPPLRGAKPPPLSAATPTPCLNSYGLHYTSTALTSATLCLRPRPHLLLRPVPWRAQVGRR